MTDIFDEIIISTPERKKIKLRYVDNGDGTYSIATTAIANIVGDIEIGAVEIKDASTDTRAVVGSNGLEVNVKSSVLPTGAAKEAGGNLAAILAKLSTDPATQTTLAAVLAKLSTDPATNTTLASLLAKDFATQTTLAAILAKIIATPATETKQDTLIAKDFATQVTLAAILAKIIAAPATAALQGGGLPAALAAGGGLKVEGVANGIAQPVSIATAPATVASEVHVGEVGGRSLPVGDETIRPADTTAYATGDAIGVTTSDTATTPLRSLAVGRIAGGSGYLTKFRLMTDQAACVAMVRVHFFNTPTPTGAIVGDNAQMTLLYTNKAQRLGIITLPALATSTVATNSTGAEAQEMDKRMQFKCAAGDTNIYYRLETLSVFTPASGQKFYLEVAPEQD